MRRLSKSNSLEYWQCIVPSVLAKFIDEHPSGESLLYHAKIVAEGFKFEMEDTDKQFRFARYQEATLVYLAHTQSETDFHSMARFYLPFIYSLVKRIDHLGPMTYATFFQQFIRYASQNRVPDNDDEMVVLINTYIERITGKNS